MSTFSLTKGSATALGMLASQAGSETLLLTQPARELRAELSIEPFTGDSGDQLLAVLFMREQRHSMTLQRNDGANAQHLADWIEAVANGTLDTAEAIPQRTAPAPLLPCSKCNGAAIGYDYSPAGSAFIHGVRCRHRTCQVVEGAETEAEAHDAWNAIQLKQLVDPSDLDAATAAFNAAVRELNEAAEPAPAQGELLSDEIHQMAFEEGQPAEDGDGYLFTAEEFDLFVERLLRRATPAAQSALEQALALAAARLDRLGLNQPAHSKAYREARDWADEAMVALRDYRATLATSPTA